MRKILSVLVLLLVLSPALYALEVSRTVFPKQIKKGEGVVISVTIKKQGEEGFAKLMEKVPEGFRVEEMNSANGNFIAEGGQVRIIWLTMPDGDEFKAEYKLIYEGEDKGSFPVDGKFYFVKDDKRTEKVIKTSYVKVFVPSATTQEGVAPKIEYDTPMPVIPPSEPKEEEPIASSTTKEESSTAAETAPSTNVEATENSIESAEATPEEESIASAENTNTSSSSLNSTSTTETKPTEEVAEEEKTEVTISMEVSEVSQETAEELKSVESENIVEPSEGLIFKVQLGAYSKQQPDMSIFGELPNVHFGVENGLYKYYAGNYTSEYEVRDIIKQAQAAGFVGAFLVRFKDGKKL